MTKVFCFGLGWLGEIVVSFANQYDMIVEGTTSSDKAGTAKWNIGDDISEEVTGCTIMVAIPASKWNEKDLALFLVQLVEKEITNILWVSSIGVYPEGEDFVFDEQTDLSQAHLTEKNQNLLMQEEKVLNNFPKACILRLGGLFGFERHPAKYFQNDRPIKNVQAPANMIHGNDAAQLLLTCLSKNISGVVNGVPPEVPSRKHFYQKAFQFLALGTPNMEDGNIGKLVKSNRVNKEFQFKWQYKSALAAYEL
jgi:hypothetical protein